MAFLAGCGPAVEGPDSGNLLPFDAGGGEAGIDAGAAITCHSCHGSEVNDAPPMSVDGGLDRASTGVGAHQAHLKQTSWHRAVRCEDCHVVPQQVDAPGHLDAPPAEVVFSEVGQHGGAGASWNGDTCTVWCHAPARGGGALREPKWTRTDISQAYCGDCHGIPPPWPHPQGVGSDCSPCHLDAKPGLGFVEPDKHINGVVDVTITCTVCHGSAADNTPAPPRDVQGNVSTTARGVGAHRSHLAASTWHNQIKCSDCHQVPQLVDDPGHFDDSPPATLTWGPLAQSRGAMPEWTGTSCSNYCHGATIKGGANKTPTWTAVGTGEAACGTCHSLPPQSPHPQTGRPCGVCHAAVFSVDGGFVDPSLHINGLVEAQAACGACHALPPATGAHLKHAGLAAPTYGGLDTAAALTNPTGYAFGCGYCHPLDPSHHMNGGRAELELYNPAGGGLKALPPATATYTPGGVERVDEQGVAYTLGTCANVYCHSRATYETPSGVPAPGVDFPFTGYPVVYPSFTVTKGRAYASINWGDVNPGCGGCHGLPPRTSAPQVVAMAGQSHSYVDAAGKESGHAHNHGLATPLPCRTCHQATVTAPNATWLDGGISSYGPVPIVGFGWHVNGRADVVFDKVNAIAYPVPLTLEQAAWNQSASTCTDVACHKKQASVQHGAPFRNSNGPECNVCHQY